MPVLTYLTVQVKRQPAIQRRIVRLHGIHALLQLCRPARTVFGYCQVGHADVEQVRAFELQVAKIQRTIARIVKDRDFDAMRAVRRRSFRTARIASKLPCGSTGIWRPATQTVWPAGMPLPRTFTVPLPSGICWRARSFSP